jgi:hypothetical protein
VLQVKATMLSHADPVRCAGRTAGDVCANAATYMLRALVGLRA